MTRRLGWVRVLTAMLLLLALCTAHALAVRAGEIRGPWMEAQLEAPLAPAAGGTLAQPRQTAGGTLAQLPLYFIENRGQLDPQVAYYVQGKDKTLYFTSQGVTFALSGQAPPFIARSVATTQSPAFESRGLLICTCGADAGVACDSRLAMTEEALASRWVVKLEFVGANPDVRPVGADETGGLIHYFKGRPEEWVTGAETYSGVVYRDLWPGIDLEYRGLVNKLKYQFVVHPGADPSQIRLAYSGATEVTVDEAGRLRVSTPLGGFEDDAPYAYQQAEGGAQVEVEASFQLAETLGVSETPRVYYGFHVGDYDPTKPLILDPTVLNYCGYLGGLGDEEGSAIAVDAEGNAFVTGSTGSTDASFPVTFGPDLVHNGSHDAFVAKVRADGSGLVYCGYIGGSHYDTGEGIAVDSSGQAYVCGSTTSDDSEGFPATIGPSLSYGGDWEAWVAKVRADGADLLYCGYIGGTEPDSANAIAVDGEGSAYVAGEADSSTSDGFPATVGPGLIYRGGGGDAFVAKVMPDGRGFVYCGYIGGLGVDRALGIAVDGAGRACVAGLTYSNPAQLFPVDGGPDLTYNGDGDGFVAKVRADGTGLDYCGYLGGLSLDECDGLALDTLGNAYVTGYTESSQTTFPDLVGPDVTHNGNRDAFVAKVTADGSALTYCGYVGGSGSDEGYGVGVDGDGNAYITGYTMSDEATFPVTGGPDLSHNGGQEAFVARVRADGAGLDYCGYIGGDNHDSGLAIAVDGDGNAYVTGETWSTQADGFPLTMGPDLTFNGSFLDAFVARVGENRAPTLGTVIPSSGSSKTGATAYITTTWKDADGGQDLKQCYFHIGASPSLRNNVTLMYNARKNKLWLLGDDGSTWLGGSAPGSPRPIENSQATLQVSLVKVTGWNDTVQVRWVLEFKEAYIGVKRTGLKCKDEHKAKAKGAWKGTWLIR